MEKKKEKIMNLNAKKIVLIVLFALVCGGLGFALAHFTLSNESKNDNQTEEKKQITHSDFNQFYAFLDAPHPPEIEASSLVTLGLMVNNKLLTIDYKEDASKQISVDINDKRFLDRNGFFAPRGDFRYKIFRARDNKEYLIISQFYHESFNYIIDENGTTIKTIDYYTDVYFNEEFNHHTSDCYFGLSNEDDPIFYIEDGYIYYYQFNEYDINNKKAELELVKVNINNSTITETKTGIKKDGWIGQCD